MVGLVHREGRLPGFARPLNKRGGTGPKAAPARGLDRQSWFGSETAAPAPETAQPWSFLQRPWPPPAPRLPVPIQAKLVVGGVDDPQEQEAERVAAAVTREPPAPAPPDAGAPPSDGSPPPPRPGPPPSDSAGGPIVRRKCACGGSSTTPCEACSKQNEGDHEHTVQRATVPGAAAAPLAGHASAEPAVTAALGDNTSAGPLSAPDRAFFEGWFGHELSRVRVHTGHAAATAASAIGAEAFTVGTDIAFADGRYRPGTDDGRRLLAHELTHVVQQGGASPLPGSPRMTVAQGPTVVARKPAPDATPASDQRPDTPEDKFKGTAVSRVVVSLARGRVGFQTPLGTLLGSIGTDLQPGKYVLTPQPTLRIWRVNGPGVRSGLRFDLTLDNADPWTLTYPDKVPLLVTAGSEEDPATFGDMIDPSTGEMKDPLALFEGTTPQEPVAGIDDFEDVRYDIDYRTVQKNLSKFLMVFYRDNSRRDINIDDIKPDTPRLWAAKQDVLKIMDEYLLMLILGSFPSIFFILTMQPMATSPTAGARPRWVVSRQIVPKSGGAPVTLEPESLPGQPKPGGAPPTPETGAAPGQLKVPEATAAPEPVSGPEPAQTPEHEAAGPTSENEPTNPGHKVGTSLIDESRPGEVYLVRDPANPRFAARGSVTPRGELEIDMRTRVEGGPRSKLLNGSEQFRKIVRFFSGQFSSIKGNWQFGDNLNTVNKLTAGGKMSVEEAAGQTWTGEQAAAAGYKKVTLLGPPEGTPGNYTTVKVLFEK